MRVMNRVTSTTPHVVTDGLKAGGTSKAMPKRTGRGGVRAS